MRKRGHECPCALERPTLHWVCCAAVGEPSSDCDNPDGGEHTSKIKGRWEIHEQTETGRRRKEISTSNKEAVTLEGQGKSVPRSRRGE